MKTYCQQCGAGVDYTYEKPNFCTKCGASFSSLKSSATSTSFSVKNNQPSYITRKNTYNQEPEEAPLDCIKGMSELEVDITTPQKQAVRIQDIAGTRKEGEGSEFSQGSSSQVNQEEFMENFKKEAGFYSSRQTLDEET
jgi:hypothetical protein